MNLPPEGTPERKLTVPAHGESEDMLYQVARIVVHGQQRYAHLQLLDASNTHVLDPEQFYPCVVRRSGSKVVYDQRAWRALDADTKGAVEALLEAVRPFGVAAS